MPTIIFLPLVQFGSDSFQLTNLHHLILTASYIWLSLNHNADYLADAVSGADAYYIADAVSDADADELCGRRSAYGAVQLTMPAFYRTPQPSASILNFEGRKFCFRLSFLRKL